MKNNNIKFYVNGFNVDFTSSGNLTNHPNEVTSIPEYMYILFGGWPNTQMSDFRYYNIELDHDEIKDISNLFNTYGAGGDYSLFRGNYGTYTMYESGFHGSRDSAEIIENINSIPFATGGNFNNSLELDKNFYSRNLESNKQNEHKLAKYLNVGGINDPNLLYYEDNSSLDFSNRDSSSIYTNTHNIRYYGGCNVFVRNKKRVVNKESFIPKNSSHREFESLEIEESESKTTVAAVKKLRNYQI